LEDQEESKLKQERLLSTESLMKDLTSLFSSQVSQSQEVPSTYPLESQELAQDNSLSALPA